MLAAGGGYDGGDGFDAALFAAGADEDEAGLDGPDAGLLLGRYAAALFFISAIPQTIEAAALTSAMRQLPWGVR